MNIDVSIADDAPGLTIHKHFVVFKVPKTLLLRCVIVCGGDFETKLLLNVEQSEGNIRTSITETQHGFGGSLHTPDFVSASPKESSKKKC